MDCLVKRSQALRGRNLARDSQADGAPRVHQAPGRSRGPGLLFTPTRTPEFMPQKIPGSGAEPQRSAIHAPTQGKTVK
jgi:hypothetical protein